MQSGVKAISPQLVKQERDQWANLSANITIHCMTSNHGKEWHEYIIHCLMYNSDLTADSMHD